MLSLLREGYACMIANNLDMVNLAIFEREETLRRHHLSITTTARKPFAPWSALRIRLGRHFGLLGGDRAVTGTESRDAAEASEASFDRPAALTLVPRHHSLPVAIADEAIDRAA